MARAEADSQEGDGSGESLKQVPLKRANFSVASESGLGDMEHQRFGLKSTREEVGTGWRVTLDTAQNGENNIL